MENPMLMRDSSEKDGKAEIVMDYVLSWCLRCAQDECFPDKPILKKYCRFMLSRLLKMSLDGISVQSVEVWKEWNQIDLCVEVVLKRETGEVENHAIMIENKYYTGLHLSRDADGNYRNQLLVYRDKFDKFYDEKPEWKSENMHYCVITCVYRDTPGFKETYGILEEEEYKDFLLFSLKELVPGEEMTESDIYNEFMIGDWH